MAPPSLGPVWLMKVSQTGWSKFQALLLSLIFLGSATDFMHSADIFLQRRRVEHPWIYLHSNILITRHNNLVVQCSNASNEIFFFSVEFFLVQTKKVHASKNGYQVNLGR